MTLGGVKADASMVNSTAFNAVTPAHATGPIDVVVTNPDGQSSTLAEGFTYVSQLTTLDISGNTSFTSVGETSQLTVTAGYADGVTRDITREVRWYVTIPSVATISADGVLTARATGATSISVYYPLSAPTLSKARLVSVTPPGTFATSGRVREPGAGDLNGVLVRNAASGQSTVSDAGQYSFGGLTNGHLSFSKNDYEPVELDVTPGVQSDVPMQRVIRVVAGSAPISRTLAPNDVDYLVSGGTHCQPCRLIRITSATPGTAQLRLTWTDTKSTLKVWVNGRVFLNDAGLLEVIAEVPLGPDEAVVFVGKTRIGVAEDYVPFTVSVTAVGSLSAGSR